jgi:hypothetical protein
MSSNRALVRLAIGALAVVPAVGALPGTALAADAPKAPSQTAAADTTAPPPGSAEAYALLIDPLLAVGHTSASAGSSSSSATGNAVELGGEPLIDGTTGGTQTGPGSKHGALLDTGVTPLGQLEVTPWSADVKSTDSGTTADGDAALLRLFLGDPTLFRAAVLQSHSHAESNSAGTSGSSSSDGAYVNAGDGALEVRVLHAESSSKSGASSYLVGINGNNIGTSDDANGSCVITVPDVASLSCLSASGGAAPAGTPSQAGASVGDATIGSGQAGGTVAGTKSSGQAATLGSGTTQTGGSSTNAGSNSGSNLPFTGTTLPPIAAIGAFLLAAGAWMQHAARRFRRTGALAG